jgi:hypothetical protein
LVEPQNQGGGGFLGLGLKTGSSGLVILTSKSPRRFFGLGLKTKQASVCRLCHKTDRVRSARDTYRDLAACLAWKQVWQGFPSRLKTGGGVTMGGACGTIAEVAFEAS